MAERDDRPKPAPYDDDPDAPASAEEIAASQRLRDALASKDGQAAGSAGEHAAGNDDAIALALALRAAWAPAALSADENLAVLDVTPTADEQRDAHALRDALQERRPPRDTDHGGVHLAAALRAAWAPPSLDVAEHRRLVEAALNTVKMGRVVPFADASRRRQTIARVAFGALAGGLALAASVVLVITSSPTHGAEALANSRTTQPLFTEPFKPGQASARIDRIAAARASDFRDNRFTKWGVR